MALVKRWSGSAWVSVPIKRWSGSAWDLQDSTKVIPTSGWTKSSVIYQYHPDGFVCRGLNATSIPQEDLSTLNAFVSQLGNRWIYEGTFSSGIWIAMKYPETVTCYSYYYRNSDDVSTRGIGTWTVQVSANSTNGSDGSWTTIHTKTNAAANTSATYTLNSTVQFTWIRMFITKNVGGTTERISCRDFKPVCRNLYGRVKEYSGSAWV